MRWQGREKSTNVRDSRGKGGAGRGLAIGGGGGCLTVIVVVLFLCMGGDINQLMQNQPGPQQGGQPTKTDPQEDIIKEFLSVVLKDTETVWHDRFRAEGLGVYIEPTFEIFDERVITKCGPADKNVGPFYCPADQTIYMDLIFANELSTRFKAKGDFALAYVLAHEVGHHVQQQLGMTNHVHSQKGRVSESRYNELSVRLELQADFLAGYWTQHAQRTKDILEPGDLEEALGAAQAVGDDTIQRRATGRIKPDSFTHGTSEQRARWFRKGLQARSIEEGDTFNATSL